jgi:uncharacterized protein (DUF983 family)
MKVTRLQILGRGLLNRCPNCGGRTLFRKGSLFEVNASCPACGLKIERDEGFFLGSLSINYAITLFGYLIPVVLLAFTGAITSRTAVILGVAGAVVVPALFYRSSRSWWLMMYYYFLPGHLPANQPVLPPGEDENT